MDFRHRPRTDWDFIAETLLDMKAGLDGIANADDRQTLSFWHGRLDEHYRKGIQIAERNRRIVDISAYRMASKPPKRAA